MEVTYFHIHSRRSAGFRCLHRHPRPCGSCSGGFAASAGTTWARKPGTRSEYQLTVLLSPQLGVLPSPGAGRVPSQPPDVLNFRMSEYRHHQVTAGLLHRQTEPARQFVYYTASIRTVLSSTSRNTDRVSNVCGLGANNHIK